MAPPSPSGGAASCDSGGEEVAAATRGVAGVARPPAAGSSPIREMRKPLRRKRRLAGLRVLEASMPEGSGGGAGDAEGAGADGDDAQGGAKGGAAKRRAVNLGVRRHTYRRLMEVAKGLRGNAAEDYELQQALERLPAGLADDYFLAPQWSRIDPAVAARAADEAPPGGHGDKADEAEDAPPSLSRWLRLLRRGFSLLVRGVGSKRRLLEVFADEALLSWGAAVVRICAFDARLSLVDCLRDALERLHPGAPRSGSTPEALALALRRARRAAGASGPLRPLCFVVHNLELLQEQHQAALACIVASPGVHLVASVDSIWAPLQWTPASLRDFNFCCQDVHTYEPYEAEVARRYPGGVPAWADPCADRQRAPKASLGLVLRSLTGNHRELVQVIAEHQLQAGPRGGISISKLLVIASDRMIAANISKLRGLLTELRDHEAVVQRNGSDGSTLYMLPCDAKTLQRLAEGLAPESDDE